MQIHTIISLVLAILICAMAIWRGDQSARWSGAVVLAGWLGSILIHSHDSYHADHGVLAIDIAILSVFVWISMRTRRLWTILASAFAALLVASYFAVVIDLRVTINTLKASMAIWSYGILACIAFGTWAGWQERGHATS